MSTPLERAIKRSNGHPNARQYRRLKMRARVLLERALKLMGRPWPRFFLSWDKGSRGLHLHVRR